MEVENRLRSYLASIGIMPNQVAKVFQWQWWTLSGHSNKRFFPLVAAAFLTFALITFLPSTLGSLAMAFVKTPHPKVILISLDGGAPFLANKYLENDVLSSDKGLGLLKDKGVVAQRNLTCTPSLTAACHISIGTGSTTANTDIPTNSFELVASPLTRTISGFAAPIGGYSVTGPAPSPAPTAEPIWIGLRASGKKVVAATFPGADGANITVPGLTNLVQSADQRTVDYTVPFGAFAGASAQGFSLTAADFSAAPQTTIQQLNAAGKKFYSPVLQKTTALNNFTVGGVNYTIQVAALDTSNDRVVNYDTLVFFDTTNGISPGPFSLPSTGPAYVRAVNKTSSPFYLEGSSNKAGTGFYVSNLTPNLSTVRIIRYGANSIPRNPAVIANVDDINNNVGFWSYQADFRIPERLTPGLATFPDIELEESYEDQVRTFVDYQTRVALRAISQVPDADLALVYIEQPDGSEHQFLLTDPRQATNPTDPTSINNGQDPNKIARYQKYLETAYKVANKAVERIINAVGTDRNGRPKSNIIVTSDHGFATFHTSVDINSLLRNNGIDLNKVRAVTSGPAVNFYINLQGRESGGTVSRQEYVTLQKQIVDVLQAFVETNPNYTLGANSVPVFDKVYARPIPNDLNDPAFGIGTNGVIGQDFGDVLALLTEGYNFDGIQSPVVQRLGDSPSSTPVLSVSSFYGAHGYDATIPNMSAIFFAAGPDIQPGTIDQVSNIDLAPTINRLLGVQSAPTVQGNPIDFTKTSSRW